MMFLVLSIIEPDGDGELANDELKEWWSKMVGVDAQQQRPAETPGPYAAAFQVFLAKFLAPPPPPRKGEGEKGGGGGGLLPPSKK